MARTTAASVLLGLALVAAACGVEEPPELSQLRGDVPREGAAPTTDEHDVEQDVETDVDPEPVRSTTHRAVYWPEPEVTVLDPGAEPRRELRLEFEPGAVHSLATQVTLAQQPFTDGTPASPEVELTFGVDIESRVLEIGERSAILEVAYTSFSLIDQGPIDPAEAAHFERSMSGILGPTAFVTLDDRGARLRAEFPLDFPDSGGAISDWLQDFDTPLLPFPVEAVGVGARWQVEDSPAPMADPELTTITEFQLLELNEDDIVVSYTGVTTIGSSTSATPQGTVELIGGEIAQRGTITWSFDSIYSAGVANGRTTMNLLERIGDEQVEVAIRQRVQVLYTLND